MCDLSLLLVVCIFICWAHPPDILKQRGGRDDDLAMILAKKIIYDCLSYTDTTRSGEMTYSPSGRLLFFSGRAFAFVMWDSPPENVESSSMQLNPYYFPSSSSMEVVMSMYAVNVTATNVRVYDIIR